MRSLICLGALAVICGCNSALEPVQQPDSTTPTPKVDSTDVVARLDQLEAEIDSLKKSITRLEFNNRTTPKLPSNLKSLRFKAIYFSDGPTSIGDFTIDGPVASTLSPLSGSISKLAYDTERNRLFGRGHHDVYTITPNEKPVRIEQDPALEEMSWLSAIAYDVKNERLLASTFAGGGCLYAYYPDKQAWEILSRPGLGVSAFVHAPKQDRLFGVNLNTGSEPIKTLYQFNMKGARLATRELSEPIKTALGYGPTQLVWLDGWLFLIQSHPGPARGYLIDPSTGIVHRSTVLKPH